MTYFLVVATLLFGWLGVIWERSNMFNTMLKFVFVVMAVWGYIIKGG